MDRVQKVRMRMHPVLALAIAGATIVACDSATPPLVASLGGVKFARRFVDQLGPVAEPGDPCHRSVGAALREPARTRFGGSCAGVSLEPRIAVVNQDGIVTAVAAGQATILARLAFDTNRVAPATIVVPGVVAIPGIVVVP